MYHDLIHSQLSDIYEPVERDFTKTKLYDTLQNMEHGLVLCPGSGKTGKSSGIHYIINAVPNLYERRKIFYDQKVFDPSIYPGYELVDSLDALPPDSVCIWEDVVRLFPSRNSGNSKELPSFLSLISHDGIIVFASVQNLADFDIAGFRSQRVLHLHSYMFESDLVFERPEKKIQQAVANARITRAVNSYPDIDPRSFKYSAEDNEVVSLGLMAGWGRQHSHMFRRGLAS